MTTGETEKADEAREPGWYTDPAPADPMLPTTMRWWDGTGWTTQVRAARKAEITAWREAVQAERVAAAVAHAQHLQEQGVPADAAASVVRLTSRDVTPDGRPLAGWWARVGATVVDNLLTSVLAVIFAWPFLSHLWAAYKTWFDLATEASRNGQAMPTTDVLVSSVAHDLSGFALVAWAVVFVYDVVFLKAFSATPGKMLLRIEVRLRERPGPLPWGTVLLRWFVRRAGGLFLFVPVVGLLGWLYVLLDDLWPTWDSCCQALHDKAARTNVVRRD